MPAPSQRVDAVWVRYKAACYLRGQGLSFGIGTQPLFPAKAIDINKFSLSVDIQRSDNLAICGDDYALIAKGSLDHVFIGNRLTQFKDPENLLETLASKLKIGGHLILHTIDYDPEKLRTALRACGYWQEKDTYLRDPGQFLGIWKLLGSSKREILPPKARAARRACIARYGAIGDMIMISPLVRRLHEEGYEVTLNITPYCADVMKQNPYVANVVLQERDAIPNQELGQYWAEWMPEYDKYINLSESIEGRLLKVEGRRDFYTSKAWRAAQCGSINYYDHTMRLGGYESEGAKGELYFSKAEEKDAQWVKRQYPGKFLVLWGVKGSSYHKVYPKLQETLTQWLASHSDAHVLLTGGPSEKPFQFEHPQVTGLCGEGTIRQALCLTKHVDLVVGPESNLVNAAGCFPTPKIILLSHSSHENLCKHFENHVCLEPTSACYPCHQLHYSLSCPTKLVQLNSVEQPVPICAAEGVSPERLIAALDTFYARWQQAQPQA